VKWRSVLMWLPVFFSFLVSVLSAAGCGARVSRRLCSHEPGADGCRAGAGGTLPLGRRILLPVRAKSLGIAAEHAERYRQSFHRSTEGGQTPAKVRHSPRERVPRKDGRAGKARLFLRGALFRSENSSASVGVVFSSGGLGGLLSITLHMIFRLLFVNFPERAEVCAKLSRGRRLAQVFSFFADTHQSWLHSSFRNCTVGWRDRHRRRGLAPPAGSRAGWITGAQAARPGRWDRPSHH
jgi:hypothetical protein